MDNIEILKKITETEQRAKSNTHRIDKIEHQQDALNKLAGSVQVLAEKEERVESDVSEIKSDVKNIAAKPGKRWEHIVDKILLAIITGLVAYILYRLGLSS